MSKERFDILFDKVYVVSLPSDIKRRESIAQELSCYGLEPSFVDGVQMNSIADNAFLSVGFWKEKEKEKEKEKFVEYRKRVCGAYLAHLQALQKVFDFDTIKSKCGMILEDDVILSSGFKDKVVKLIDSLEEREDSWLCCSLQRRLYQNVCHDETESSLYFKGTTYGHQGYIYNRYCDKNLLDCFFSVLRWGCNEEIDSFYVRLSRYFPIFGTNISILRASEKFESNISLDKDYLNKI